MSSVATTAPRVSSFVPTTLDFKTVRGFLQLSDIEVYSILCCIGDYSVYLLMLLMRAYKPSRALRIKALLQETTVTEAAVVADMEAEAKFEKEIRMEKIIVDFLCNNNEISLKKLEDPVMCSGLIELMIILGKFLVNAKDENAASLTERARASLVTVNADTLAQWQQEWEALVLERLHYLTTNHFNMGGWKI